jgi:hypothetical protein
LNDPSHGWDLFALLFFGFTESIRTAGRKVDISCQNCETPDCFFVFLCLKSNTPPQVFREGVFDLMVTALRSYGT